MNNGLNRLLVYWNTNQLAEVSSQQLPKSGDITRKYWDDDHVYRIIFRLYHINIYIYVYVYWSYQKYPLLFLFCRACTVKTSKRTVELCADQYSNSLAHLLAMSLRIGWSYA